MCGMSGACWHRWASGRKCVISLLSEIHTLDGKTLIDDIQGIACRQGNLMLGLGRKGLCFYHPDLQQFAYSSFAVMGLKMNGYSVNDLPDGLSLLSTDKGLFALDTLNHQASPISMGGSDFIRSMVDSKGRIWAGSFRQGLFLRENGTTYHIMQGGIPARDINYDIVRGFLEDSQHRIWMAASQGLIVYSPTTRRALFPKELVDDEATQVKLNGSCKALLIDHQGWVWVGTFNGLFVINPKDKSSRFFGKAEGMPNEMIGGLIEDRYGNVWATTPNGLCRFLRMSDGDLKLIVFDSQNKLGQSNFAWMSVGHLAGGNLFFGTQGGYYVINPADVKDNEDFCHFLSQELNRIYNKVMTAKDGIEGAMMAETENPDIIVSDVMMPRMSGTDMCRRIKENIDNSEYTIDYLAADVVMSRMSLYRKMKSLTGQTPADFIRMVRLKTEAKLLKEEKCNVSEACCRTGFASPQNFAKHFKEMFGVLPSHLPSSDGRKQEV